MKWFNYIILIFNVLFLVQVNAQDIHLSNLPESYSILNPGAFSQNNSKYQFLGIIRQQWSVITDPYTTQLFAFEKSTFMYNRILNMSLLVVNQEAGKRSIKTNRFLYSIGYKTIQTKYAYSIGVQCGLVSQHINTTKLTTPSQYDETLGSFSGLLPSMENNSDEKNRMIVVNAGGTISKSNQKSMVEAGLAIHYFNRPLNTLSVQAIKIPIKKVIHVKTIINSGSSFNHKGLLVWQNSKNASELVLGYIFQYNKNRMMNNFRSIEIGSFIRTGIRRSTDALILHIGSSWKRFTIYYDYDITISSLHNVTQHRSSSEICLKYIIPNKSVSLNHFDCQRY